MFARRQVNGNPALASFPAFGSFAMLLLVYFSGSIRDRPPRPDWPGGRVRRADPRWDARLADDVAGGGGDGRRRLRDPVRRCRQLGAGRCHDIAAAGVHPSRGCARAGLRDSGWVAGWGLAAAASVLAISLLWPSPRATPSARRQSLRAGRSHAGCAPLGPLRRSRRTITRRSSALCAMDPRREQSRCDQTTRGSNPQVKDRRPDLLRIQAAVRLRGKRVAVGIEWRTPERRSGRRRPEALRSGSLTRRSARPRTRRRGGACVMVAGGSGAWGARHL